MRKQGFALEIFKSFRLSGLHNCCYCNPGENGLFELKKPLTCSLLDGQREAGVHIPLNTEQRLREHAYGDKKMEGKSGTLR